MRPSRGGSRTTRGASTKNPTRSADNSGDDSTSRKPRKVRFNTATESDSTMSAPNMKPTLNNSSNKLQTRSSSSRRSNNLSSRGTFQKSADGFPSNQKTFNSVVEQAARSPAALSKSFGAPSNRASPNPSLPSNTSQESVQYRYQTLKRKRESERLDAIANGFLADPNKPRTLAEAITPVGTCPDMCPEFERVERVVQNDVWAPEYHPYTLIENQAPGKQLPDEARMVKKFRRAAAGIDEQLPSDLRPPHVLQKTVHYLFDDLLKEADDLANVHHFIWDRTRAIRNDFSIQQVSKAADVEIAIDCYERIARFHILSLHQLALPTKPYDKYDAQQEREQLDKTLLSLMQYYDDYRDRFQSPNEAEFRAYCIIFQIQNPVPDLEDRVQTWPDHVVRNPRVQYSLSLYAAACNVQDVQGPLKPLSPFPIAQGDWGRFWRLVNSSQFSYLMSCVAEIYFPLVRRLALTSIWKSYRAAKRTVEDWTTEDLIHVFNFETAEEIEDFCEQHGFTISERADGQSYLNLESVTGQNLPDPTPGTQGQRKTETVERKRHHRMFTAVINGMSVQSARDADLIEDYIPSDEEDNDDELSLFVSNNSEEKHSQLKATTPASFATPATSSQNISSSSLFSTSAGQYQSPTTSNPTFGTSTPAAPLFQSSSTSSALNPFPSSQAPGSLFPAFESQNFGTTTTSSLPKFSFTGGNDTNTSKPAQGQSSTPAKSLFDFTNNSTSFPTPPQTNPFNFSSNSATNPQDGPNAASSSALSAPLESQVTKGESQHSTTFTNKPFEFSPKVGFTSEQLTKPEPPSLFSSNTLASTSSSLVNNNQAQPIFNFTAPNTASSSSFAQISLPASAPKPLFTFGSIQPTEPSSSTSPFSFHAPNPIPQTATTTKNDLEDHKSTTKIPEQIFSANSQHQPKLPPSQADEISSLQPEPDLSLLKEKRIEEKKKRDSDTFQQLAQVLVTEPEGVLEQYIQFTVMPMIQEVRQRIQREALQKQADNFRAASLAATYGRKWREIWWSHRLARQGRERRQRSAKQREERVRRSRESSINSTLEDFRRSFDGSKSTVVDQTSPRNDRSFQDGTTKTEQQQDDVQPPFSNLKAANVISTPSLQRTGIGHRRSESDSSHLSVARRRRDRLQQSLQFNRTSSSLRQSFLVDDQPGLHHLSSRNYAPPTDTTRSTYFRLKAMGLNPSEATSSLQRKRASPTDPSMSPPTSPNKKILRSVNMKPPTVNAASPQSYSSEALKTSLNKEDEELFAAVRQAKQAMSDSITFFKEEIAKDEGVRGPGSSEGSPPIGGNASNVSSLGAGSISSRGKLLEPPPAYRNRISKFVPRERYAYVQKQDRRDPGKARGEGSHLTSNVRTSPRQVFNDSAETKVETESGTMLAAQSLDQANAQGPSFLSTSKIGTVSDGGFAASHGNSSNPISESRTQPDPSANSNSTSSLKTADQSILTNGAPSGESSAAALLSQFSPKNLQPGRKDNQVTQPQQRVAVRDKNKSAASNAQRVNSFGVLSSLNEEEEGSEEDQTDIEEDQDMTDEDGEGDVDQEGDLDEELIDEADDEVEDEEPVLINGKSGASVEDAIEL